MRFSLFLLAAFGAALVASLLVAPQARAADGSLYCVCTAKACGNNAIGGDQGQIFGELTAKVVQEKFYSTGKTGWTCLVPANVRGEGGPQGCYCGARACGDGGIGADPLYIDLGLSSQKVQQDYGGGKEGNQTGWLCGAYRGTVN